MNLIAVFDEIVSIMHTDYSGYLDKQGWDFPASYRARLQALEASGSLERQEFETLVKDYLLDFKDRHIFLISTSETEPNLTVGFKVRRFEDKLYITQVLEETELKPGMYLTTLDGVKIPELAEKAQRLLSEPVDERQNWALLLLKAQSCQIEDGQGQSFTFTLKSYPFVRTASAYALQMIDQIPVLKLNDFNDEDQMNRLLAENQTVLEQADKLIIDIRINHGGSDLVYFPLLKYICSPGQDAESDFMLFNMTERNHANRLKQLAPLMHLPIIQTFVEAMESHRNQGFVHLDLGDDAFAAAMQNRELPRQVVVLIDSYCGSSGDQFALIASQSEKVTLIGRNTLGTLDYSNLAIEDFSEAGYQFWYPTSKSSRIEAGEGIDGIGVEPDIYIPWTPEHLQHDHDLEAALDLFTN